MHKRPHHGGIPLPDSKLDQSHSEFELRAVARPGSEEWDTKRSVVIQVKNLSAHYGERQVLKDVNLTVRQGEILMIIGGSGCGKTTLLKHMIGLLDPSEGEVEFWGVPLSKMSEDEYQKLLGRIGVSFQSGGLFNSMTLGENVAMPLVEQGQVSAETIRDLVDIKLQLVGLGSFQHLMPSELSGGMKKRAGFARALALDPELMFFDEPSSGLDPIIAAGLDELLVKMARSLGLTMVIVSHDLASIIRVADRVLMLDLGEVIFSGTLEEAQKSEHPRVSQFFKREADEAIETRVA